MESITYPDGATPLDPDEIRGLKFKHITTRNQLDQLEQANIQNGFRWLARRKHSDILHEGFVRELHKKLFGEVWSWAGSLRTWAGGENLQSMNERRRTYIHALRAADMGDYKNLLVFIGKAPED